MTDSQVTVTVLDLSPLGACLEHAEPLLPGQPCRVTFAQPERASLQLPARVVWCRAHACEPEEGRPEWSYTSGVEFRDVPPTAARDLGAFLDRVKDGDAGSVSLMVP